jgi:hypothetical protein
MPRSMTPDIVLKGYRLSIDEFYPTGFNSPPLTIYGCLPISPRLGAVFTEVNPLLYHKEFATLTSH